MAESESILAALENCENEPIRTPNAIQPHGCVCVCDLQFEYVTHVSQNVELYLNRSPDALLGQPVNEVFDRTFCHAIRNAASLRTVSTQREFLGDYDFGAGLVEVVCHQRGPYFIVELGQKKSENTRQGLDINRLRWLMSKWEPHEHALSDALEILVHDLRMLTGFSRVMAYRFRPDGSGEVIAESLAPKAESYLGLRFPKWDIPDTARAIGLEQPLRHIADVSADDVPLLSWRTNSEPVDMTLTELRATSPVHKKYLSNMGVNASLVMPVVHKNELWGMFSFQHNRPRKFTIQESLSIEFVGQMLNAHLGNIFKYNFDIGLERCGSISKSFSQVDPSKSTSVNEEWNDSANELCAILNLDGVTLEGKNDEKSFGVVPKEDLTLLKAQLNPTISKGIFIAEDLDLEKTPGALMIEIEGQYAKRLWLFRKEENSKINWAGAPQKEIEASDGQVSLRPRSSFQSYTEISKGKSRAWEPEDLAIAIALQTSINQAAASGTGPHSENEDSDFVQQQVRLVTLMLRSMAGNDVAEGTAKPLALASFLEQELGSSAEHNLHEILTQLLDLEGLLQIDLIGKEIALHKSAILPLSVAVREILDALKSGQPSSGTGHHASINWEATEQGLSVHFSRISIRYFESKAFLDHGSKIVEEAIRNLGGNMEIDGNSEKISLNIPVRHLVKKQADTNLEIENSGLDEGTTLGEPFPRVLVLEDNDTFEVELRIMLRKLRIRNVVFSKKSDEAITIIESMRIDMALLNTRLLDPERLSILDKLLELKTPCAFITSFRDESAWVNDYQDHSVIVKPVREDRLKSVISPILHSGPATNGVRILLIEDNAPLQEQLKSELTGLGYFVECASNVREAENILSELSIDIIVIDIFIDLGNGHVQEGTLRIVSRIRNEISNNYRVDRDIPILAISGSVEIPGGYSPLKMAKQIGVNECMQKPLNISRFVNWISDAADKKQR